ncbi:MAG: bifunctional metallophosphatase/5'-nucleotidase [Deltaproteobacteria bacterium]|nr:MAG: bifunctional metallophosphatase/5'-nucleotidase [Deltaproteobacteria bacterium]
MFFRSHTIHESRKEQEAKKAELILEAYKQGGYDAINVGNSDLALGKDFLLEQQKNYQIPFVSANIVDKEKGKPVFTPYLTKKVGGLTVGIFGLISDTVPLKSGGKDIPDLTVKNHTETAKEMVKELRKNSDLLVCLSYLGTKADGELAQEVKGIDIIVSGNGRGLLKQPNKVNSTLILQASQSGKYVGKLDLHLVGKGPYQLTEATGDASQEQSRFANAVVSMGNKVKADPRIAKLTTEYQKSCGQR